MGILTRTQHMGLAALIMSVSILLSRFMGLLRDKVISWQFGASGEADLYFAAFVVPDFINYLLAGGYISITLMPLLAKRFEEDEADAWNFFSAVFWWALLAATLLTLVAFAAAEPLARITAPGFSEAQTARLAHFLRIILPAQIFFLGGACFSALLFLRRQFAIPALTPLIYNGCIILGGLLLPLTGLAEGMEGFCWGVTIGAALGAFALPVWAASRQGLPLRLLWRHPLMGRFLCIALPLMLGQSVVMLNEQFLRIFGSLVGDGAVSLLSYARRISQVPVGMVGQAVAVASYPFLASLAAKGDHVAFGSTLRTALQNGTIFVLPLGAWMIAAAEPVMGFIFRGGQFGAVETLASTPLLQIMLLGVPLWGIQMVLGRGFYAHGDTLTPALVGTGITVLSLPLFYASLPWGALGIAGMSLLGVVLYVAVLMLLWRKRYGMAAFEGLGSICVRGGALAVLSGLLSWLAAEQTQVLAVSVWGMAPLWSSLLALASSGLIFALVYGVLGWKLAPALLAPLRQMVTTRLRRGATMEHKEKK